MDRERATIYIYVYPDSHYLPPGLLFRLYDETSFLACVFRSRARGSSTRRCSSLFSITLVYIVHLPFQSPSQSARATSSVDRVLASRLHYRLYCINHPRSPREAGKTMVEDPIQSFSLLSYSLIVGSVYLRRAVLSFELYKHVPLHDRCCLPDATLKTESIRKMNRSARAAPLSISLFLFSVSLSCLFPCGSIFLPCCTYPLNSYFERNLSHAREREREKLHPEHFTPCMIYHVRASREKKLRTRELLIPRRYKDLKK